MSGSGAVPSQGHESGAGSSAGGRGQGAHHPRSLADVPIRPAATVVLLRTAPSGLEVFLQHRASGMEFAPDVTVFPGGGIEPADDGDLTVTAARETMEECGVRLDPDDLVPLSRWITPPGRPRRYDTMFYLAALPAGQEADCRTTEAVSAGWSSPRASIDSWLAGEHKLMAPTYSQLFQLLPFETVEDALGWAAESADLTPVAITDGMTREDRRFPGYAEYAAGSTIY
ncbi:NUDIX hydrolase OS=Tsukamurella paurometabola (strain ATCC 8368 / DSM / CCUG 35730 / CIP 100753/ JCM 10117 / KCTC 9821 / NBRC 16120 / NCIMB 702349 / NCTC 13040) OX=521096 GN=Tpau_2937 PE=4 SV=1 [Tsukamurella paurometabola]|uniref:NUDIX hydrolase n=1 Tax=Tsukamurella paurometabola (strain ATCC 8368 / DSM 20162 / CCUG 35730 / CIP 100753 / JCM 10117 / KCTC 9821 / NBRC 16120 / NCIMB 702349 / NCTC 13040) TaxID=521096 RepID=D5UU32_TSUPD|nr:NUDIX domain-containing protein [Tsukamurella paurometabola]ADG79535.1 NUDIX hydrolase [Tsukamurella paurometabola DSM 20162]SUP36132.1 NUDIX domain [Tsukamurella paurometabola]